MADGERYCLLVDPDSRLPLFYPCLFVTTQVRNRSLSVAAMEATLAAISVLLTHCVERGIDLEHRIRSRQFLRPAELDAIRDDCQERFSATSNSTVVPLRKGKRGQRVGLGSEYIRLSYIAEYIRWLSHTLFGSEIDQAAALEIDRVTNGVLSRRPKGKRSAPTKLGFSAMQIAKLQETLDPTQGKSPFQDEGVCIRNALIVDLLLHLGIRGGELLNICIRDIDWERHQLVVARRPDEKADTRKRQPLVKTLDRRIPLRNTLINRLHDYVVNYRRKVPGARRHDYLFVTHKSGKTQGAPLSMAGYQKIIKVVATSSPELNGLHGHLLRHCWNERFSDHMDKLEHPPSPERQEAMRSYALGWKEGSGTSATYNRRFVERKAHEVQLALQKNIVRIPKGIDE